MKRLTDEHWRNFDPWECCGQDKYCQRGCHDEGGCANGCIVPKLYARLARYEDTGLEPEKIMADMPDITAIEAELDRYKCAEAEGRLLVLPCRVGTHLWKVTHPYKAEPKVTEFVVKNIRTAGKKHRMQIEVQAVNVPATNWMEPSKFYRTREEAEAALRKEEK